MLAMSYMNESQQGTVKESVSTLMDDGRQTIDALKSKAADVRDQVRDNSSAVFSAIRDRVEASPIKSLGVALGLGYLAARIRTSPVLELAFLGAFGYLANRVLKLNAGAVKPSSY